MSYQFEGHVRNFSKNSEYQLLAQEISLCHKCPGLNIEGLTESAPGFGSLFAKVMIVGQSLCRKCMETQIPFTGGSGRLLDNALKKAEVKKSDVFITNVVHCHTPNNRKSLPLEVSNCRRFLIRELSLVQPKAVVPLGQDAIVSILGEAAWPTAIGKNVQHERYLVFPMYHPSYVLRKGPDEKVRFVSYLANILREFA